MTFDIIHAPQRSAEWRRARAGRLTGSMADRILMKGRGNKESVMRRDYRLQLIAERISGQAEENYFFTADMQRGIDLEPRALATYEAQSGELVERSGFLSCRDIMAGCSLDGHIGQFTGIIEIKCPKLSTHLSYWARPESLGEEYAPQVAHNLWVTGAAWCDLISFDDRVPDKLQLLMVRIMADSDGFKVYEAAALEFLSEVDAQHRAIIEAAA